MKKKGFSFNSKDFQCDLCAFETAKKISLRNHIISQHTRSNVLNVKCPNCRKFITESNLWAHLVRRHYPKLLIEFKDRLHFRCCKKIFLRRSVAINHCKAKHDSKMIYKAFNHSL